jgi:pyrroline-5-carboxylate reductase
MELGIIGGGVMGEAILSRLLAQGIYAPTEICVSDPQPDRCQFLQNTYGITVSPDNQLPAQAKILLLAVKPQNLGEAIGSLEIQAELVLSILAGTTLTRLAQLIPDRAIVRVMPNTPARVGAAVSAIAMNELVTERQRTIVATIFNSIGTVVFVPENLLDAVTGLSGSAPAFVAIMIEALADGGVRMGLPRTIAQTLAIQTVLGTALLLKETGLHPAQLKDQVASAGGTTIAGIDALEQGGIRATLINAVKSAVQRAHELGEA